MDDNVSEHNKQMALRLLLLSMEALMAGKTEHALELHERARKFMPSLAPLELEEEDEQTTSETAESVPMDHS